MTNRMIDWITSRPVGWLIDSLTWRFNQWSVESFVYCTCVAVFVFVLNNLGPKSLCVPCFGIIFLHQSLFQVLGHTILMCIAQVLSAVPQPSQCQGHPERLESLKTVPFEGKNVWMISWTLLDQQHLSSSRDATFSPPRHRSFGIQQVKGLAFDVRRGVAVHLLLMQCALCFSISISIFLNNHDIGVTIHIMWKKFSVLSAFLDHFNTETIFS